MRANTTLIGMRGNWRGSSEGDPFEAVNRVEVRVVAQDCEGMLACEGSDPGVIAPSACDLLADLGLDV